MYSKKLLKDISTQQIVGIRYSLEDKLYDLPISLAKNFNISTQDVDGVIKVKAVDGMYQSKDEYDNKCSVMTLNISDDIIFEKLNILQKHTVMNTIRGDDLLEEIECIPSLISYWLEDTGYRYCYFTEYETYDTFRKRVIVDESKLYFLDIEQLLKVFYETVDRNALFSLHRLAILFDDEDGCSNERNILEEETGDEYAQEICLEILGITWVEQSIVIINIRELLRSSYEIANEPDEYRSFQEIFLEGLVSTLYHECRHLLYECNEMVQLGEQYTHNGGLEDEVEDYGNRQMERYINQYVGIVQADLPIIDAE